jgi:hypothetical protein
VFAKQTGLYGSDDWSEYPVRKRNAFFEPFSFIDYVAMKTISLPRQAWDKHNGKVFLKNAIYAGRAWAAIWHHVPGAHLRL